MSWLDKINTDYVITCGDGKQYRPMWLNAEKGITYNHTTYDFIGVQGTYVRRETPRGREFPIEIIFQGADHLDTAQAFELSAANPKEWIIAHPYYGSITVQPTSLRFNNAGYNTSVITGVLLETITKNKPSEQLSAQDVISDKTELTNTALSNSYANNNDLQARDIRETKISISKQKEILTKSTKNSTDFEKVNTVFNVANSYANNIIAQPLQAIRQIQQLVSLPYQFIDSVSNRIAILKQQFESLLNSAIATRGGKKYFETVAGTVISAMAGTPFNNADSTDFDTRNDVLIIIRLISSTFDTFLERLDELQSETAGDIDSYIPDFDSVNQLSDIVSYSLTNLFAIAEAAKQEFTVELSHDSNVILETNKYYGLDKQDVNLDLFIRTNNISLNELFELKKGRLIKYYI